MALRHSKWTKKDCQWRRRTRHWKPNK